MYNIYAKISDTLFFLPWVPTFKDCNNFQAYPAFNPDILRSSIVISFKMSRVSSSSINFGKISVRLCSPRKLARICVPEGSCHSFDHHLPLDLYYFLNFLYRLLKWFEVPHLYMLSCSDFMCLFKMNLLLNICLHFVHSNDVLGKLPVFSAGLQIRQ